MFANYREKKKLDKLIWHIESLENKYGDQVPLGVKELSNSEHVYLHNYIVNNPKNLQPKRNNEGEWKQDEYGRYTHPIPTKIEKLFERLPKDDQSYYLQMVRENYPFLNNEQRKKYLLTEEKLKVNKKRYEKAKKEGLV